MLKRQVFFLWLNSCATRSFQDKKESVLIHDKRVKNTRVSECVLLLLFFFFFFAQRIVWMIIA